MAAGRQHRDVDLEIVGLARLGACRVGTGEVAAGRTDLQQAMTAAVSGEGQDVQYVGEALCTLLEVSGWLGDPGMVEPWAQQLAEFRSAYAFGPLLPLETTSGADLISAFCTSCCGGVYLVTGRLDVAERELADAVTQLATTGCRPRCLHPVARLAELRVLQGRLEEAEALLVGFESEWECAVVAAALDIALGRPKRAVAGLVAALDGLQAAAVLGVPVRVQLVDAALAAGDLALAERTAASSPRLRSPPARRSIGRRRTSPPARSCWPRVIQKPRRGSGRPPGRSRSAEPRWRPAEPGWRWPGRWSTAIGASR